MLTVRIAMIVLAITYSLSLRPVEKISLAQAVSTIPENSAKTPITIKTMQKRPLVLASAL